MGSISDYAIGEGTSVPNPAAFLDVDTGSLRLGDLGYSVLGTQIGGTGPFFHLWAFVPASLTAVDGPVNPTVVYADTSLSSPAKAGRWHLLNVTAIAPYG